MYIRDIRRIIYLLDREGLENAINDFYLSDDIVKIINDSKINNIGQTGSVLTLGQYNKEVI